MRETRRYRGARLRECRDSRERKSRIDMLKLVTVWAGVCVDVDSAAFRESESM